MIFIFSNLSTDEIHGRELHNVWARSGYRLGSQNENEIKIIAKMPRRKT